MCGIVSTVVFAAALGVWPALAQELGAPHQSAQDEAEHLLDMIDPRVSGWGPPGSPAAAFGRGVAAYKRQDYATALQLFRPLAEQGDAKAQFNLGVMYDFGRGVPQDSAEAAKWYRKAAQQGDAQAEFDLGMMYALGEGVPHLVARDRPRSS